MKNDNKKHRIGIVDFALIDAGLSHHEAIVYSYVERFEKNKRSCFASIPHIAAELRFSECSTKRHIRRLITLNLLRQTTKGRGRYLNTTGVKMTLDRGQIELGDRGQIEPLPLEVLPIEDTNIKIPIKNYTKTKPKTGVVKGESVRGVTPTPARKPLSSQTRHWLAEMTGVSLDDLPN